LDIDIDDVSAGVHIMLSLHQVIEVEYKFSYASKRERERERESLKTHLLWAGQVVIGVFGNTAPTVGLCFLPRCLLFVISLAIGLDNLFWIQEAVQYGLTRCGMGGIL
jgi:hypothetical protein